MKGFALRPDLALAALVGTALMLMVVPLPTLVVDMLLACSMGLGVLLLMTAFYLKSPVQFSTLPSLILVSTVFRLSLSVAVTRLVLLEGDAGEIVQSFGDFVVGGNLVVGLVIFLIITVVQFIVITKGAERVAEVAARFTLDALPGKQMAIDAELRSGEIDQATGRKRRAELERESQLYGAMDGAMKFVKGDAIAGLVIIAVNLIGGLVIGTLDRGMGFAEAARTYSILTVGDGLVAQLPALLVSLAAGAVVTRVAGAESDTLGGEIALQLGRDSRALWPAAGVVALLGFVPGFPTIVFLALGGAIGLMARAASRRLRIEAEAALQPLPRRPSRLRLLLGPGLRLDGAALANRAAARCAALAEELGLPVPAPDILASPALPPETFRLELDGVPLAETRLPPDRLLLRDDRENAELAGVQVEQDTSFPGLGDAAWVPAWQQPALARHGIGFLDANAALAEAIPAVLRPQAALLVGIQETRQILAGAESQWGELVREAQRILPLQRMADLFRRLLDEDIGLRNLRGILEAVIEHGAQQDPALLAEAVRSTLRRQICHAHADALRMIGAYVIDPAAEAALRGAIQPQGGGTQLVMAEGTATALVERIRAECGASRGPGPVVLTALDLRRHLRNLLVKNGVRVPVLSFHDLLPEYTVQPLGTVRLTEPSEQGAIAA